MLAVFCSATREVENGTAIIYPVDNLSNLLVCRRLQFHTITNLIFLHHVNRLEKNSERYYYKSRKNCVQ